MVGGRSAHNRLVALLAKRDHSRRELNEKLRRAQHSPEEIENALRAAEERGWLPSEDDLAKREAARLSRGGRSARQIRAWLLKKGLPQTMDTLTETDETAAAERVADRAWSKLLRMANRELVKSPRQSLESAMRLRVVRLLVGRGFGASTAQAVYARLLKKNPLK